ncbi:hypothetical protein HY639_00620 [Candidatus Woesearchaeota archaeon]|nr:hypothetical protein [Candidatus Woesearchaeota archaeon]
MKIAMVIIFLLAAQVTWAACNDQKIKDDLVGLGFGREELDTKTSDELFALYNSEQARFLRAAKPELESFGKDVASRYIDAIREEPLNELIPWAKDQYHLFKQVSLIVPQVDLEIEVKADSLSDLVKGLDHELPDIRAAAADSLRLIGREYRDSLMTVTGPGRYPEVEKFVTRVREFFGAVTPGVAVTKLITALKDSNKGVRSSVAESLVEIGLLSSSTTRAMFPSLIATLKEAPDKEPVVDVLARLAPVDPLDTIPRLLDILTDPNLGPYADEIWLRIEPSEPILNRVTGILLIHPEKARAVALLAKNNPEAAVAAMLGVRNPLLQDPAQPARELLLAVGVQSPVVVKELLRFAYQDHDLVAINVLGELGDRLAYETLSAIVKDESASSAVKDAAAHAMARMRVRGAVG